jgi:restriction system protein
MMDGAWFVRADEGGVAFQAFRMGGHVAIGWKEVGPVASTDADEATDALFVRAFPDAKPGARRVWAAQTRRFAREIHVGDRIMSYDPSTRLYLLGTVRSDLSWVAESDLPRVRKVAWENQVLRDTLSAPTRNTLGAIQTIFRVDAEAAKEVWDRALALDTSPVTTLPEAAAEDVASGDGSGLERDMVARATRLIEDRIMRLTPDEIPDLFGGILRAMGYKTRVSPPGPDRGVDIFASPDGLGLQEPRIFVEVKHRRAAMAAPDLRTFLGGRKPGDRCIYVSTGGFTKEARYEADRSSIPLALVDLARLAELLVEHYESLDVSARTLIPLTRLHWPID